MQSKGERVYLAHSKVTAGELERTGYGLSTVKSREQGVNTYVLALSLWFLFLDILGLPARGRVFSPH